MRTSRLEIEAIRLIHGLEKRAEELKKKLLNNDLDEDGCPICGNGQEDRTLVLLTCCHNFICGACLAKSFFSRSEPDSANCPFCRGQLAKDCGEMPHRREEEEYLNRIVGRMVDRFERIGLDVQRTVHNRSEGRFTFTDLVREALNNN
jgi:hypothetical protein